jgi:excinuclease ABC subunit C
MIGQVITGSPRSLLARRTDTVDGRGRHSRAVRLTYPLDEIAGVGALRKRALLQHFGSARAVAGASLADLEAVEGVSSALAKKIYDFFHVSG